MKRELLRRIIPLHANLTKRLQRTECEPYYQKLEISIVLGRSYLQNIMSCMTRSLVEAKSWLWTLG
uniref:Uncharacterized protein n=1 Tax=Glossina morsitans morsitans TaxID=37546 RepID=A0A1B0FIA4_GLOMM